MSNADSPQPPLPADWPVIIVTGLSGAGKSTALSVFEDLGFFTVDGLPVVLAKQMVGMPAESGLFQYKGVALGMDLRQNSFGRELDSALEDLHRCGYTPRIMFLEASADELLKRYAATRRPHPLEKEGFGLQQALEEERRRLSKLRETADVVVDTSSYSIHNLRRVIQSKWKALRSLERTLSVHIVTFGFKHGTPREADMVFDLRFLPNPYFVPGLKPLSGLDKPVSDYVLSEDPGKTYAVKLLDLLRWVLEQCEVEGRYRMTIAVGCTGGRHRSVAMAEYLAAALSKEYPSLSVEHRHLDLG